MSREKDIEIAIEKYGWTWVNAHGIRNILLPPENDPRYLWTALWDKNGVPNYLPKYSEGEE